MYAGYFRMMIILIKNHIYLYFITCVPLVCGYVYTDENGITINYAINFKNKCRSEDGRVAILQGLPIAECVAECGLRQHCSSLNYRRREHACELFSSAVEGDVRKGDCIFIPASDITVQENPCDGQDCTNYKTCDTVSNTCNNKECSNEMVLHNGEICGNMNDVGDTIKYDCNSGYEEKNGTENAVCLDTGQWNQTAECVSVCGDLPSVSNGQVTQEPANVTIASVLCDAGYQSTSTIVNCLHDTRSWESVTCERIACGTPPTISNGNTVLDVVGGNLYLDTASVSCITGYQSSVGTITCTANGSWETTSCERISCGNPPSISNGNVVLNTLNGNSYLDQATVTCDGTYRATTNVILCKETGLWDSVICEAITCGSPPSIANGQYTLSTPGGQSYQDTATVSCDDWFQASASSIYCTATGSWTEATCTNEQCYPTTSEEYQGKINHTESGRLCQRWDAQFPHPHSDNDLNYFPDATLAEASNYCRNPEPGDHDPWCYTVDPYEEWEYCDIPSCSYYGSYEYD